MTIETRLITSQDLPEVFKMIEALTRFNGDEPTQSLSALRRDLLGTHPWYTVIVAETRVDGLLGYAALLPLGQLQFGRRGMDVHHLYVRDTARGQGVGSVLIAACRDHAKALQCTFLMVGTHPDNHKAADFYVARGFIRRTGGAPRFTMPLTGSDQPPT